MNEDSRAGTYLFLCRSYYDTQSTTAPPAHSFCGLIVAGDSEVFEGRALYYDGKPSNIRGSWTSQNLSFTSKRDDRRIPESYNLRPVRPVSSGEWTGTWNNTTLGRSTKRADLRLRRLSAEDLSILRLLKE